MRVSGTAATFVATCGRYGCAPSPKLSPSVFSAAPSIVPAIVGRGSTAAAAWTTAVVESVAGAAMQNFSGDAAGYFKSIRIPATLLAGSSLASLFGISDMGKNVQKKSERERWFVKAYHVLSLVSFATSITTILFCTSAGVAILYGNFDPMAETGYMLLNREFEFEFLTARLSFLVSLLTFMVGVEFRMLLEFDLLSDDRLDVGYLVSFVMLAFVSHFLSYSNETMYCSPNLLSMILLLAKVTIRRVMKHRMPMQLLSLILASLSAGFIGKFTLFGNDKKNATKS